ncbi:MAG TPA: tetratricopeptide repeat protein [Kofleriaceae bacterium]|nr:tetratricopeptide repeat protein [Kofleriaceae bacterium]
MRPRCLPIVFVVVALAGAAWGQSKEKKPAPTGKGQATRPPTLSKPKPPPPAPTTEPSAFAAANRAYKEGRYDQAIPLYEALVATGVHHEDLFYNLGNAYFRAGRLGSAIYQYERALRIDPGHDDARYNLEIARQVIAERVVDRLKGAETDPWWVRLATFFSLSQLALGFLILDVLLFAGLIALRFLAIGFARSALIATVAFIGLSMIGSMVLLRAQVYVHAEVHQGIVIADQVVMREGADQRSAERGKLHPGVRVRLRGSEPGWLRIRLANGMEGWVPDTAVGRL